MANRRTKRAELKRAVCARAREGLLKRDGPQKDRPKKRRGSAFGKRLAGYAAEVSCHVVRQAQRGAGRPGVAEQIESAAFYVPVYQWVVSGYHRLRNAGRKRIKDLDLAVVLSFSPTSRSIKILDAPNRIGESAFRDRSSFAGSSQGPFGFGSFF